MLPQLFLIAASFGATEAFDSLILWVETTPQEVRLGDPVFVRISARNTGKEPIVIPARFPQEIGGLCRFELVDNRERTRFAFFPDGGGSGGVSKTTLAPDDASSSWIDSFPGAPSSMVAETGKTSTASRTTPAANPIWNIFSVRRRRRNRLE